MLAALAAMTSPATAGAEAARGPIYLAVEPLTEGVRFTVLGESRELYKASFKLEVVGDGNRSSHSGSATLVGGKAATLSTVTLGQAPRSGWRALLRVIPVEGETYEELRASH